MALEGSYLLLNNYSFKIFPRLCTLEALVCGHRPRDVKKVLVTGADRIREFKNTEFVSELRKTRFCEGGLK